MGLSCSSNKNINSSSQQLQLEKEKLQQSQQLPHNQEKEQTHILPKLDSISNSEQIQNKHEEHVMESKEVDLDISYSPPNTNMEDYEIKLLLTLNVNESIARKIKRPDIDVAILLDVSYSMKGEKLEAAKKGIISLLNVLGKNDRISIIIFRGKAKVHLQWTQNCSSNQVIIIQSIAKIQTPTNEKENKRDFEEAIEKSLELLETSLNTKVMYIMITDGEEYFTTDLDKAQSHIFRCSSPKQYSYYIFSLNSLNPDSILKQFSTFTNGFNVLVPQIDEFIKLLLFTCQQILLQFADTIRITITIDDRFNFKLDQYGEDQLLIYNNSKCEIRLKSILIGLDYHFPIMLLVRKKIYDSLEVDFNLINVSIIGNKNFRISQMELEKILKLSEYKKVKELKPQLIEQQHQFISLIYSMQQPYKLYINQQFQVCFQQVEAITQKLEQPQKCQNINISYVLLGNEIKKLFQHLKRLNELFLQNQANLDRVRDLEECQDINILAIESFNIINNLYENRQDLNYKDSYSYSQSVMMNQYNLTIKKHTDESYRLFIHPSSEDVANDLDDSDGENYLYKATKII